MPDLTVIAQPESTAIELLVADYHAACRARGVSAKSIRFSYGYSLKFSLPALVCQTGNHRTG